MRTLVVGLTFVSVALIAVAAGAQQDHVTICHATGSTSNPFVLISPSVSGVFHGHLHHGDDIIPPFEFGGQTYSLNWDAEGQAILRNGCEAPAPPTQGGPPIVLPSVVVTPPPFTG
jgi:hypothetical protein